MQLEIHGVYHDRLFRLALVELLVGCLVDALRPDEDPVRHAGAARNREGLVRPLLDGGCHPTGPVAVRDLLEQIVRDFPGIGADLALEDAAIPDAVEVVLAGPDLADVIAAPVIREGDVEWLMEVADPVAQELERLQPGDQIARRAEDLEIGGESRSASTPSPQDSRGR